MCLEIKFLRVMGGSFPVACAAAFWLDARVRNWITDYYELNACNTRNDVPSSAAHGPDPAKLNPSSQRKEAK